MSSSDAILALRAKAIVLYLGGRLKLKYCRARMPTLHCCVGVALCLRNYTPTEGGHFEWNDHHFSVEYSGVTMLPQDGANNIGQKVALVATVKSSATLRNGRLRVLLLAFKGTSGFSLN